MKIVLLGVSTVSFILKNFNAEEILWDNVNVLFLVKLSPMSFSIHWFFLHECLWWLTSGNFLFSLFLLHLLVNTQLWGRAFHFFHLFMLVHTCEFLFYSMGYNLLLIFHYVKIIPKGLWWFIWLCFTNLLCIWKGTSEYWCECGILKNL